MALLIRRQNEWVIVIDLDDSKAERTWKNIDDVVRELQEDGWRIVEGPGVIRSSYSEYEELRRLAVETWLQKSGVIIIAQNKKVLPIFLEKIAHN